MAMGLASQMLSTSSGETLPVAHFTLGEEKNEESSESPLERRGRPGPDGIRVAHGSDRIGRDCFHEDARTDGQQRILKRRSEPVLGQLTLVFGFEVIKASAGSGHPTWTARPDLLVKSPSVSRETGMNETLKRLLETRGRSGLDGVRAAHGLGSPWSQLSPCRRSDRRSATYFSSGAVNLASS
jgi:hypothetical protein